MNKPNIVITNDDGIHAPGLYALAEALAPLGEVTIVAPDRERSAVSHAFTMNHPLRITRLDPHRVMIDGTPVDCVIYAVRNLFADQPPDLIVSGINNGPNMGDDVFYSGTVAAAHEGQLNGVPSLAVSMRSSYAAGEARVANFPTAGAVARRVAEQILQHGLPDGVMLNLNVPNVPLQALKGVRLTRLGRRIYKDMMIRRQDPRGGEYYWLGGEPPSHIEDDQSDFHAVREGYAALTPLRWDIFEPRALETLKSWRLDP